MRKLAWYAGVVCLSTLIAVICAEVYLSWRTPRGAIPFYNKLYPYVMFRPHENDAFVSAETHVMSHHRSKVFFYTNEEGFRVSAPGYGIPRQKPPGQFRVAVLGGSAVQTGSTFETTLPGSVKRVLQSKLPKRDIEVINAGVQSSISRQSLVELLLTVVDYHPDVVILYDGANDLGLPLTYESRANCPYNFQTMETAWDQYTSARSKPLLNLILERSRVYGVLKSRADSRYAAIQGSLVELNALPPKRILADGAFITRHVSEYLSNWRKLIELSAVYDYQPVLVLQPTGGLEPDYALSLNMKTHHLDRDRATEWGKAFAALYREASRQIEEMRKLYPKAVFVDLSGALVPGERYFWDGVHVYDETNMLLAEKLCQAMRL